MTTFGVETWHPNPSPFYTKNSGPLFDMGPYYLSAIVSLLGPIESIAAFDAKGSDTRHIYVGRAIEGIMISSENGVFYKVKTTCERPEPLKPGGYIDEV